MKNKKPAMRSRFKMGLRSQQVILFLLVSLTPLLLVSLTIRKLGGDALKSSVGEGMVSLARVKLSLADRAISHKISNIRRELRQEDLQFEVAKSNNANGNKQVFLDVWENLEDSIRLLETYAGGRRRRYRSEIIITNAEGYVLHSNIARFDYNFGKELPPLVDKDQIWWIKARNNGNGSEHVEDVTYDTQRNVHRLLVALPIRMGRQRPSSGTQNKIVGICKAILYLPELADLVELQSGTDKTYTILTNQSGKIIATPQESEYHIGDQISMENATMRAIIEAKKDEEYDQYYYGYEAASETDRFNESRVYGWARTRPVSWHPWKRDQNFGNWIIFVSYPSSEAYAGVVKLNQYVLWLTILSCVVVIPFAYVVAKRISQPVMQLAQAAKRIGQEAKDVVQEESDQVRKQIANMQWYQNEESELISIGSKNEVGMLAQEFNDMHRNLKIAVEKLISAEQQMTTIVDCLGEGLIVVDTRDRILYFNPAAKHLLNFNETSQFPDLFTELLSITNLTVLANTHGQDTRATVEINLDQEGENRILRVVTSQFTSVGTTDNGNSPSDENTDMAGMVYVFDDITRQHEIDKMKSDFVALVSHELRTPLTSIIGFISLILDGKAGPLNEVQQQSLTRAHRQSERLATMINDLLDISRIEAGRIVMKLEPVNLTEIAQQRLEELKPQADEKTIKLDMNVQPDLPELTGDAEHLGQILTNLVGNAIKFTPSNGEVRVRMFRKNSPLEDGVTDENDGVHVEVIDTGPGIPAQDREDVFDKFRQLSNIQTREQGGTGLGLAIARGFVEAHKGKIWVDAGENDKGCNFQFWIPFLS